MGHMRTLILPDIHHKIMAAQAIIDNEKPDRVVHLGDHQDDWDDTPEMALETARWTRARLEAGDTICLGNHDISYLFPKREHQCSGYTYDKARVLMGFFTPAELKKFHIYTYVDGWLCSHAGVTAKFMNGQRPIAKCETVIRDLLVGMTHPLVSSVGYSRGGDSAHGGVTWEDWSDFVSTPGVNQIMGHSMGRNVRTKEDTNSMNYCIDTRMRNYAIVEDGVVEIKSTGFSL